MKAIPAMNEEMGKAFCREFWRMMETENSARRVCELLRKENKELRGELKGLRAEVVSLRQSYRFCMDNHDQ